MKNIKLQMILFLLLIGFLAQAQQTTLTSGGEASGNGGKISYSIGQVFYSSTESSYGIITEGIQQAYEIIEIGITEVLNFNFEISAFPNPTKDLINLKVDNYNNETFNYSLMDMRGSILENNTFNTAQVSINMSSLPPSTYFIRILYNNKEAKIFKIIKN